jgi:hypothetical protein
MRHDLTDDEAEQVHRHLHAAADRYGLPLTVLRPGCWLILPGTAVPAWVLAWKTGKGRYRLHVMNRGWTYSRRADDLAWLLVYLDIAVGGIAATTRGPRCEPST